MNSFSEVNYKHLNVQRVLRDIGINMQFKVEASHHYTLVLV